MELLVRNEELECRRKTELSPSKSGRSQDMEPLLKTHLFMESSVLYGRET